MQEITWSEWLEFNQPNVDNVPKTPGVFKMHASMKMMYIGNSENLNQSLNEALKNECTSNATRFCYTEISEHQKLQQELVQDFRQRHDGKLPKCMSE